MVSLCNCMNSTGTAPPVQSIVFSYRYCPACPVGHDLNYIFNLIAYRNRGVFRGGGYGLWLQVILAFNNKEKGGHCNPPLCIVLHISSIYIPLYQYIFISMSGRKFQAFYVKFQILFKLNNSEQILRT